MLVLQIAAGILLAALIYRFWRQALLLAGVLLVLWLAAFAFAWIADNSGISIEDILRIVGFVSVMGVVAWWKERGKKRGEPAVIVDDDRDSPSEDPPASHPS